MTIKTALVISSSLVSLFFAACQPVSENKSAAVKKDSVTPLLQRNANDTIFFDNKLPFEISGISNAYAHSSDTDTAKCKDWSLNEAQIRTIIKNGKPIDGPTWHYDFLVFVCSKYIKISQQQKEYSVEINAGSYFTVTGKDSVMRFGDYSKADEKYFLSAPAPSE